MPRYRKHSMADLVAGDHLALVYESHGERVRGAVAFGREALVRDDRCLCLVDGEGWDAITEGLRADGVEVEAAEESGALQRLTAETAEGGRAVDVEALETELRETVESLSADRVLWLLVQTSWALGGETFDDVERWVRDVEGARVIVLCEYRRSEFTEEELVQVLRWHPVMVPAGAGSVVFANPHYWPPEEDLEEQGRTRFDWMMRQLERVREEEDRARRSEREMETLLTNIPDVVVRVDRDHRFLFVNEAAAELIGRAADEAVGRTHEDLGLDPERSRSWLDAVDRAFEEAASQQVTDRVVTEGGDSRWFRSRIVPEPGPAGEVGSVLVIGQDITEERRARDDLEETMTLLERTFASLEEAVFVVGPDRTIILCNRAAESMLGYDRSELVGGSTERFHVDRAAYERFGAQSEGPVLAGEAFHGTFELRRKDGRVIPTEHTVTLLDPDLGIEAGVVSVVRDLTERRQTEELLDALEVAVFRSDADGLLLNTNAPARRILRLPPEESLEGRYVDEILASGETWQDIARRIAAGEPVEARVRRSDGTVATLRGVGRVIEDHGGEAIYEGVVQDVTREVRLRKEVVEISAEERRRIGQDLHDDLGQHLTGLALMASDLARQLEAAGREEAADARDVERHANRAVVKTRHLARGVQPPALEGRRLPYALEQLGREVEELFGLEVVLDIDETLAAVTPAQAEHLYRIAQEAITNAARHGQADTVKIRWRRRKGGRVLEVADNGTGFEAGTAGEGVGLRIMEYRARLLGGAFDVVSAHGEGTRIRCRLADPERTDEELT